MFSFVVFTHKCNYYTVIMVIILHCKQKNVCGPPLTNCEPPFFCRANVDPFETPVDPWGSTWTTLRTSTLESNKPVYFQDFISLFKQRHIHHLSRTIQVAMCKVFDPLNAKWINITYFWYYSNQQIGVR